MKELTLVKNPMFVSSVGKPSFTITPFKDMNKLTPEKAYEYNQCGKVFHVDSSLHHHARVQWSETLSLQAVWEGLHRSQFPSRS